MHQSIRALSPSDAAAAVSELALALARANGIQGALLSVSRNEVETERRGKTPVHWVALFEAGATFDGPIVVNVNLETGHAQLFEGA